MIFLLVAVVLCTSGCGRHKTPRFPVRGRVTLHSKSVSVGTIVFENATTGTAAIAPLDGDGSYVVKTCDGDGLPAGDYRVAVSSQVIAAPIPLDGSVPPPMIGSTSPAKPGASIVSIPTRYRFAASSGLTATVKSGESPQFDFDLVP